MDAVEPIAELIEQFRRLQGIGAKSAQRLVFQLLSWPKEDLYQFAAAIRKVAEQVSFCPQCFNFSTQEQLCTICRHPKRDPRLICVVSNVRELSALERTNNYSGTYHVLQGLISPLEGISPDQLTIKELLSRVGQTDSPVEEIVLALNPSTEGEATTLYLTKLLRPLVSKISRLSFGLSVGGDIDQTDELTLIKAFEGRREC